jgi:hypothetical protein
MSSLKGKADLFRSGKNGTKRPVPLKENMPSSVDNKGVFANSTPGLAKGDSPASASPGSGRAGLDMFTMKGGGAFNSISKAPGKKDSEF